MAWIPPKFLVTFLISSIAIGPLSGTGLGLPSSYLEPPSEVGVCQPSILGTLFICRTVPPLAEEPSPAELRPSRDSLRPENHDGD